MSRGRFRLLASRPSNRLRLEGVPVTTALEGIAYDGFEVFAINGVGPFTWAVTGNPSGTALSGSGASRTFSGTPSEDGSFSVLITCQDSTGRIAPMGFPLSVQVPSTPPYPSTQTVGWGELTLLGHGGDPVQYTGSDVLSVASQSNAGGTVDLWRFDAAHLLTSKGTLGASPPTYVGPYTVGVTDGTFPSTVTLQIEPDSYHVTATAGDTASVNQLAKVFSLPALDGGQTVIGRSGYWNPSTDNNWRLTPAAASFAGGGVVTLTSDVVDTSTDAHGRKNRQHGFRPSSFYVFTQNRGNALYPILVKDVFFELTNPLQTSPIVRYSSVNGWGLAVQGCRFSLGENGPPAPTAGTIYVRSRAEYPVETSNNLLIGLGNGIIEEGVSSHAHIHHIEFERMRGDAIKLSGENALVEYIFNRDFIDVPDAHQDFIQHGGFKDGLNHAGSAIRRAICVSDANVSLKEPQGIFATLNTQGSTVTDWLAEQVAIMCSHSRGIQFSAAVNAKVRAATLLRYLSYEGGTSPLVILDGTGGEVRQCLLTSAPSIDKAIGAVAVDNVILPANLAGIRTALPNYRESNILSLEDALFIYTPSVNGAAKLPSGKYAGMLFPPVAGETIGAWNDLSVFEPDNPDWVAAHPTALADWIATAD